MRNHRCGSPASGVRELRGNASMRANAGQGDHLIAFARQLDAVRFMVVMGQRQIYPRGQGSSAWRFDLNGGSGGRAV